jgi:hypothetical protein
VNNLAEISSQIEVFKKQLAKKEKVISAKKKEFSFFKQKARLLLEELPNFPNFIFKEKEKIIVRQ